MGNYVRNFGALGAFWPVTGESIHNGKKGLYAPYGARCFLTRKRRHPRRADRRVLMHLLVLDAF